MLNGIRTYLGIALAALSAILKANGVDYDVSQLVSALDVGLASIGEAIGLAIALYGRLKASKPGALAKPAEPQP